MNFLRKIGEFLLANDRNAAIIGLLFALLPLINLPGGFLASIIVGFVTLQKNYKSGLFVLAWVALPAVALLVLGRFDVFDILLLRCFLVFIFALVLKRYYSWRLVLELGALLGFVVVLGLHLFIPDMAGWWTGHINAYIKELSQATTWQLSPGETKQLIARMAPVATGISAGFVLLATFIELLVARWWQTAIFHPGVFRTEFTQIYFGKIPAIILTLILIGVFSQVPLIIDFFPVALVPFMIAGLSLLHFLVERNRRLFIPVLLVYLALFFLPVIVVGLLAIIGYIDSWVNFRERFLKARINNTE